MQFAILTVLLIAAVSGQPEGRIVGGNTGDIKNFPYQITLLIADVFQCGASVIGKRWVLTAAHCVIYKEVKDITFRAGSSLFASGGIVVQADNMFVHPQFRVDTKEFDVAVVSTKSDLVGTNVAPIEIPASDAKLPVGSYLTVSGWGRTAEDGPASSIIKYTKLKILEQTKCAEAYETEGITDVMFCAYEPKTDSCQGDSGGPAVVDKVQVGVVSWGIGCARPGNPGVFTRLAHSKVRSWIKSTTNI